MYILTPKRIHQKSQLVSCGSMHEEGGVGLRLRAYHHSSYLYTPN